VLNGTDTDVLIVGDSLQLEVYRSLLSLVNLLCMNRIRYCSSDTISGEKYGYIYMNRGKSLGDCIEDHVQSSTARRLIALFGSGPHLRQPNATPRIFSYLQNLLNNKWRSGKRLMPQLSLVWRTNTFGHPECYRYPKVPYIYKLGTIDPFNWTGLLPDIDRFSRFWFPSLNITLLDVSPFEFRHDSHPGHRSNVGRDCLHHCDVGPVGFLVHLFYHDLLRDNFIWDSTFRY